MVLKKNFADFKKLHIFAVEMVTIRNIHGEVIATIEVPAEVLRGTDGQVIGLTPADRTYDLNLSFMDLHEADLRGWDLSMANFQDTDLTNADLSGANLSNSNIDCAILDGAILDGCEWPINYHHPAYM